MLTANNLQDLFGKPPLPMLQRHLELGVQCVERVPLMLESMYTRDTGTLGALKFEVSDLAQHAEDVYRGLTRDWPKGVLVSMRRQDFLFVLESQCKISDTAQKIAALVQLPLEIAPEAGKLTVSLAKHSIKTCKQTQQVIESLEPVIRAGRKGPDIARLYGLIEDLGKDDKQVKMLSDDLTATLYEQRNDQDAVSLVFVFRLAELLGKLSCNAKIAGHRALILVAR